MFWAEGIISSSELLCGVSGDGTNDWEWQGKLGTARDPNIPPGLWGTLAWNGNTAGSSTPWILIKACVFQEPVLLVFAVFVMHNIVIPIHEMQTFLSVPIAWELLTLKSNTFSIFKLWWKMCHGVDLHKFYMNWISLLPTVMGKWWIKQVWISLWLLWGDPKIKANISLCLQMSRILKFFAM